MARFPWQDIDFSQPIVDLRTGRATDFFLRQMFNLSNNSDETDGLAQGAEANAAENAAAIEALTFNDSLQDVDMTTTPPTNGQVPTWDDANSLWKPGTPSGGGGGPTIVRPAAADFSLHGEHEMDADQTLDDGGSDGNGIYFSGVNDVTSENYVSWAVPVTANTAFTLTARMSTGPFQGDIWSAIGLFVGDSGSVQAGTIHGIRNFSSDGFYETYPIAYSNFSTNTTAGATFRRLIRGVTFVWWRIRYDETTLFYEVSNDGEAWILLAEQDQATQYGGTDVDRVGFGIFTTGVATGRRWSGWCDHFEIEYT